MAFVRSYPLARSGGHPHSAASQASQLDIPLSNSSFYTVPSHARDFLRGIDYLNFRLPPGFPADAYTVAIETLSTPTWRSIGPVRAHVKLPLVVLAPTAKFALLPADDSRMPLFTGKLVRGGTAVIPAYARPGIYPVEVHGIGF